MTWPPIRSLSSLPVPSRDHPAVVDHRDPVGELVGLLEVLGGQQQRRPLAHQLAHDAQISLRLRGSSPVVGSSRNRIRGRVSRLDARSSRRRIPPSRCAPAGRRRRRIRRSSTSPAPPPVAMSGAAGRTSRGAGGLWLVVRRCHVRSTIATAAGALVVLRTARCPDVLLVKLRLTRRGTCRSVRSRSPRTAAWSLRRLRRSEPDEAVQLLACRRDRSRGRVHLRVLPAERLAHQAASNPRPARRHRARLPVADRAAVDGDQRLHLTRG